MYLCSLYFPVYLLCNGVVGMAQLSSVFFSKKKKGLAVRLGGEIWGVVV